MKASLFVVLPIVCVVLAIAIKAVLTPALGDLEPVDLRGRTFVITGATSGLGMWQAEKLASWNASLVLPVRDLARGKLFAETLRTKYPSAPPAVVERMDLVSLDSVRSFASKYKGPVDVLVNNAAMLGSGELSRTKDGFEECLQVNYLSSFLLTALLLERIEQSPAGRIVHISAKAHEWANIDIKALLETKILGPDFPLRQSTMMGNLGGSYADSKLAQILFSGALTGRLKPNVVSLSLHPAIVKTELMRDGNMNPLSKFFVENVMMKIGQAVGFMQSTEDAPKTQVHVSTHPAFQGAGGRYYSPLYPPLVSCGKKAEDCAVSDLSQAAQNITLQEELFAASCELLGLSTTEGLCSRKPSS